jgi:hypothetical protein
LSVFTVTSLRRSAGQTGLYINEINAGMLSYRKATLARLLNQSAKSGRVSSNLVQKGRHVFSGQLLQAV